MIRVTGEIRTSLEKNSKYKRLMNSELNLVLPHSDLKMNMKLNLALPHSDLKMNSELNLVLPHSDLLFFVCFVALRPKSTAMVIAGRSVHLSTLFPGQA